MGYEVHITRAKSWSENHANKIAAQAWLEVVKQDSSLRPNTANGPYFAEWGQNGWLDWSEGNIYAKNPSPALINKMAEIASRLGAVVQGDDGENYFPVTAAPLAARLGFSEKVRNLLHRGTSLFKKRKPAPAQAFKIGDRVLDSWGKEATVIQIDLTAVHGLGKITVRYDDGRLLSSSAVAHGLRPVRQDGKA